MTLDIDESKLSRVMRLTGIRTKTAMIDYALDATERSARLKALLGRKLKSDDFRDAVDPAYDLLALRKRETPSRTARSTRKGRAAR